MYCPECGMRCNSVFGALSLSQCPRCLAVWFERLFGSGPVEFVRVGSPVAVDLAALEVSDV